MDSRLPGGFRRWRRQVSVAGVADTSAQVGVLDAPSTSTAKLYLNSVSRGRPSWHPWGPSSSPDCPCTRAWGVECTRDILKWHDFKGRSSKREIAGGS